MMAYTRGTRQTMHENTISSVRDRTPITVELQSKMECARGTEGQPARLAHDSRYSTQAPLAVNSRYFYFKGSQSQTHKSVSL